MLPSFTITSPTLMPMRSIIVASDGSARLACVSACWMPTAQ